MQQTLSTKSILMFALLMLFICGQAISQSGFKITYLFHSGWLIETGSEIILIDYIPSEGNNVEAELFQKFEQALANKKKGFILITHEHWDHFHKPLLAWNKKLPGVKTILGWNLDTNDNTIIKLDGRDSVNVNGLKVVAHPSTDIGSGFLVSAKDLTFYHAGDHAAWDASSNTAHQNELNFIKSSEKKIDIAFFPIAQGKLGGCRVTESITNGTIQAVRILQPRIVFPMHVQCGNLLPYKQFADNTKTKFPDITFRYASSNNEAFDF